MRQEGPRPSALTKEQPTSPRRQPRPLAEKRVVELQPQRQLRCGLDNAVEPLEGPDDVIWERAAQEVVEQRGEAVDVGGVEVMPIRAVDENIANKRDFFLCHTDQTTDLPVNELPLPHRNALDAVSYTHLTLPTIYSV